MASVTFILKEPKSDKETLVYLVFRHSNKRLKLSTSEKIHPNYWNYNKHRVKESRKFGEYPEFNSRLDKQEAAIKDAFRYIINEGLSPTNEVLKLEFYKRILPNKFSPSNNLNSYIDQIISDMVTGKRLTQNGEKYKQGSIKNFTGFQNQFIGFQKTISRKLDFEDITIDFYDKFVRFFNSKNYSPNTIGRHIKNLKTIMGMGKEEGLHKNTEYERDKFKVLRVETIQIYLNEAELDEIQKLDLSEKPHLEIARDVFLIGCYVAQRFSDYSRINKNNIKTLGNVKIIDLVQQKTNERVQIPIRPKLDEILKKYDYNTPKIYEQKLNQRIKEVGSLAGIEENVQIEQIKGGLKVKSSVPKNELIKTHTARRSGCTNMYLAGISTIDIMKISGHKTEREFMKYIRVTKEETARSLANHPYFNQIRIVN